MVEGRLKKAVEQETRRRAEQDAERDGDGDIKKRAHLRLPALRHAEKRGKEHDDENIVAGRARHDELRDALVHSAALLHQLHHARHDHGGRDRREHRAHNGGFNSRKAEQARRKQHVAEDLEACRQTRHEQCGTPHTPEVGEVERKTGLEQNDDERELAQLGGDGEQRRIEHIERARAEQDADKQQTDDARQVQRTEKRRQRKAAEKNERK